MFCSYTMEVKNMERVKHLSYGSSKITLKGVEVTGPLGKKEVPISGDEIEKTPNDSFTQGMAKGLGVALFNGTYPLLTGVFKSLEGYDEVSKAAKEVGLTEWQAAKAGLKGALAGGIKGFSHGFLDSLVIGSLIGFGGVIGGPIGAALGAIVGGGVYNLVKDAVRV